MGDLTLPEGNPGSLTTATGTLGTVSTDLGKQKTATQQGVSTALESWNGPRRDDFAHAGAGLQVEIAMLQTSSQKVAGLVHEYGLALKKTQDDIAGWAKAVRDAESHACDLDPSGTESEMAFQHAGQLRFHLEGQARTATHQLAQLGDKIASEIDAETNMLVPKSDTLSPDAIRRRVFEELGVTGLPGKLSDDQAWKALGSAQAALPEEDVEEDGEVGWKELADQLNNAGPAQLLAGTIGPLSGAEGWAIARFASNARDVAAVEKNVESIFSEIVGPMAELYKSGLAGVGDVNAELDVASPIVNLERTLAGNPGEQTASLFSKLRAGGIPESGFLGVAGRVLGGLGVVSDAFTIVNPGVENKTEGHVLQGTAALNIVGTTAAFAPPMATLAGINAVADWIPVAGQVVMLATGLFIAGDWAYHHFQGFHDAVDAVGHTVSSGATHVWNGVKDVGGGIKHVFSSVF